LENADAHNHALKRFVGRGIPDQKEKMKKRDRGCHPRGKKKQGEIEAKPLYSISKNLGNKIRKRSGNNHDQ